MDGIMKTDRSTYLEFLLDRFNIITKHDKYLMVAVTKEELELLVRYNIITKKQENINNVQ